MVSERFIRRTVLVEPGNEEIDLGIEVLVVEKASDYDLAIQLYCDRSAFARTRSITDCGDDRAKAAEALIQTAVGIMSNKRHLKSMVNPASPYRNELSIVLDSRGQGLVRVAS